MFRGDFDEPIAAAKEGWMIQIVVLIGIMLMVLLLIALSTYNSLMHLRQQVRDAWAHMDQQLKHRYELVPELMTIVQSIGGEPATKLPPISAAKNHAAVAFNPAQLATAEISLSAAIHELLKSAEGAVEFNVNAKFVEIRQKLQGSEKQIDRARRLYNDRIDHLNESLKSFPVGITAKLIGLKPQQVFEMPTDADGV